MYGKFATVAAIEPEIIQALALRVYNCEPSLRPHRIEVTPLPKTTSTNGKFMVGPTVKSLIKAHQNAVQIGQSSSFRWPGAMSAPDHQKLLN